MSDTLAPASPGRINAVLRTIAGWDRLSMTLLRIGVLVVLFWIGGLKWFKYEADGIVPFVANSPLMKWMLGDPANYKARMNPEGALIDAN